MASTLNLPFARPGLSHMVTRITLLKLKSDHAPSKGPLSFLVKSKFLTTAYKVLLGANLSSHSKPHPAPNPIISPGLLFLFFPNTPSLLHHRAFDFAFPSDWASQPRGLAFVCSLLSHTNHTCSPRPAHTPSPALVRLLSAFHLKPWKYNCVSLPALEFQASRDFTTVFTTSR